jgi:hypothetical protein
MSLKLCEFKKELQRISQKVSVHLLVEVGTDLLNICSCFLAVAGVDKV